MHQQNSILEVKKDSVSGVSDEKLLLINDKSVQSELKNRKHKYQIIEGQESEFFTFDNSNIDGHLMVTMPMHIAPNSPPDNSDAGVRSEPKPPTKLAKQKTQKIGERTLKADKPCGMRKSAIRPVTRKNLLAIEVQHSAAPKKSDTRTNFLDVVKQSVIQRQPPEATTTDGTMYSQTGFMKATNCDVAAAQG